MYGRTLHHVFIIAARIIRSESSVKFDLCNQLRKNLPPSPLKIPSVGVSYSNKMPKKEKPSKSTQKQQQPETPTGPVSKHKDGALVIAIHAKPGAKQNAITDVSQEAVGVAIAAPPTDGEANAELVRYLCKVLELKRSEITLDKGSKSREKVIKVTAPISQEDVLEKLKREASS